MIITDKFVMLNYPKTGSTFCIDMLKRIHVVHNTWPRRMLNRLGFINKPTMIEWYVVTGRNVTSSQHGGYRQIPQEHKLKPIVTVVRNPLQRYISEYLYGWWKSHPEGFRVEIEKKFYRFPDLSFAEYFDMISMSAANETGRDVGYETKRFVKFYFKDPEAVLAELDDDYVRSERFKRDLPEITFLHQEDLNNELHSFLLGLGYPEKDIDFIREAEKINVTHREKNQLALDDFFPADLKEKVLKTDRLLFALFPEYAEAKY